MPLVLSGCGPYRCLWKWLQLWLDSVSRRLDKSGTIIDWAYEDQCNTPIVAGAKGSTPRAPAVNGPHSTSGE